MTYLLIGLAVARATRLWRDDKITARPRAWVNDRLEVYKGHFEGGVWDRKWIDRPDPLNRRERLRDWLATLLECPWCLSGWLAAGAVVMLDSATPRSIPMPVLAWLGAWWVACAAYWLLEVLADTDSILYHEREQRGISDEDED